MLEFTRNEIRDLLIAFVVLSFCFAISHVGLDAHGILSLLPIDMIGVGIGCLLHELGQKYVATKHGFNAEFKLWPLGLLIAFITSFIGIVFASPGSIQTDADITVEMDGKIGIAGPMANIMLGLIYLFFAVLIYPFIPISSIIYLLYLICIVGYSVNSFLATFNLLPLYSLDGTKVLKWSAKYWLAAIAFAAIMMLTSIGIGPENIVKLLIGA